MANFGHFDHFWGSKMAQNGRFDAKRSVSYISGMWVCGSSTKSAFQRSNRFVDRTNESEASSQNVAFGESTSEPYFGHFFRFEKRGSMTWSTGAKSRFRNCLQIFGRTYGSPVTELIVKRHLLNTLIQGINFGRISCIKSYTPLLCL
jgi:hypothetical protein